MYLSDDSIHETLIIQCMDLASNGRRKVGNGAMVGALLVRENKIIAQDWHREFGADHAEARLLHLYKEEIQPSDILYVNLEPCCHKGKTPPCTDAIIERGIRRVCYGMTDPDRRNAGKGIEVLKSAGVKVIGPVARARCEYFNRGFVSLRSKGRPWVTIKQARTSDGRTASSDGLSLKITNASQDQWSHTYLRSRHDVILVGVETVVQDNPLLDTRFVQNNSQLEAKYYQPLRIILDPSLRIPASSKVLTDRPKDTMVIISDTLPSDRDRVCDELQSRGVSILRVPFENGTFILGDLLHRLAEPNGDFHGISSILVEGGDRTWKSFQEAGCMDENVVLIGA